MTNELRDTVPEGMIMLDSEGGKALGFTRDKFTFPLSYLWRKGNQIIVSAIESRDPGKGNFRRLVERIVSFGFDVVIPTPLSSMEVIVRKCGYTESTVLDEALGEVELWTLKAS